MLYDRIYWDEIATCYKAEKSGVATPIGQLVYVNFSGATDVVYNNMVLDINISDITVTSPGFTAEQIIAFIEELNSLSDTAAFVSDVSGLLPDTYSTIYVGDTGNSFDNLLGNRKNYVKAISETTGTVAENTQNDKAFVLSQNVELYEIVSIIAAKAEQLSGAAIYEHQGVSPELSDYTKVVVDGIIVSSTGGVTEVEIAGKHYSGSSNNNLNNVITNNKNCIIAVKNHIVSEHINDLTNKSGLKLFASNLTISNINANSGNALALYCSSIAEIYDSKIINNSSIHVPHGAIRATGSNAKIKLDNVIFAGNVTAENSTEYLVLGSVFVDKSSTATFHNIKLLTLTDGMYFGGTTLPNVTFTGINVINAHICGTPQTLNVAEAEFIFHDYSYWNDLSEQGFATGTWQKDHIRVIGGLAEAAKLTFRGIHSVNFGSGIASNNTEMYFENTGNIYITGNFSNARKMEFTGSGNVTLVSAAMHGELVFNNSNAIIVTADFTAGNSDVTFGDNVVNFAGKGINLAERNIIVTADLNNGPITLASGNISNLSSVSSITINNVTTALTSYSGGLYTKVNGTYYLLKNTSGNVVLEKDFVITNEIDFAAMRELLYESIDAFTFDGGSYSNTVYGMGKAVTIRSMNANKGFFGGSDKVSGNVNITGSLTCDYAFASGNIDAGVDLSGNSFISGSFNGKRVYGGGNITGNSNITNDASATISGGVVSEVAAGGWQIYGNSGDTVSITGTTTLNISGGIITYAAGAGMVFDSEVAATQNGNSIVNVSGGTVDYIFGGFMTNGEGNSVINGNIAINITAAESDVNITNDIYAGSNGNGTVGGNSTITFSGDGTRLNFTGIVRGDSAGAYGATTFVEGERTLQFDDFNGNFNASAVEYIDTMKFTNSSVIFDTAITGIDEVATWEIEFDGNPVLTFSGTNDFANDVLNIAGSGSGTIISGGADSFTGFSDFATVTLFNESAVYTADRWSSTNYQLFVENNEMKVSAIIA